jgi:hypothetical protein
MVQTNPFAHLPVSKAIAKREQVLVGDKVPEIWQATGDAGAPCGTTVGLLILTGQHCGEVPGTWGEISEDLSTWTMRSACGARERSAIFSDNCSPADGAEAIGAALVYTRSGNVRTQQGDKR